VHVPVLVVLLQLVSFYLFYLCHCADETVILAGRLTLEQRLLEHSFACFQITTTNIFKAFILSRGYIRE
jgi:hypothetical protein